MSFAPAIVIQQATLVSGAVNLKNVPIASATKTEFLFTTTTATGVTLTVQYGVSGLTAGARLETASVVRSSARGSPRAR